MSMGIGLEEKGVMNGYLSGLYLRVFLSINLIPNLFNESSKRSNFFDSFSQQTIFRNKF